MYSVAQMAALGLGLKQDEFTKRMDGAVQLLAPTGSDLLKYNKKDDILAGFHYGKILYFPSFLLRLLYKSNTRIKINY